MAKLEQVLILDPPSELHFKGPFSNVKTTHLKLTNPTSKPIGFKVKTTAPKTYCVRPNGGFLGPKKTVSVAVMLQPFDPETDDRSKDKFMVQSMYIPAGQEYSDSMWHDVPSEELMNSKLKCIFHDSSEDSQVSSETKAQCEMTEPKTQTISPDLTTNYTDEIKKVREENKRMKEELNELRQENATLKEEGIRTRMAYGARTKGTSAKPFESESHQLTSKKPISYNYLIIVSVLILLLGIYLGKVIL